MQSGDSGALTTKTINRMVDRVHENYKMLIRSGNNPDLALDRVWDVYDQAVSGKRRTIIYKEDEQLMNELLAIREGNDNA